MWGNSRRLSYLLVKTAPSSWTSLDSGFGGSYGSSPATPPSPPPPPIGLADAAAKIELPPVPPKLPKMLPVPGAGRLPKIPPDGLGSSTGAVATDWNEKNGLLAVVDAPAVVAAEVDESFEAAC